MLLTGLFGATRTFCNHYRFYWNASANTAPIFDSGGDDVKFRVLHLINPKRCMRLWTRHLEGAFSYFYGLHRLLQVADQIYAPGVRRANFFRFYRSFRGERFSFDRLI